MATGTLDTVSATNDIYDDKVNYSASLLTSVPPDDPVLVAFALHPELLDKPLSAARQSDGSYTLPTFLVAPLRAYFAQHEKKMLGTKQVGPRITIKRTTPAPAGAVSSDDARRASEASSSSSSGDMDVDNNGSSNSAGESKKPKKRQAQEADLAAIPDAKREAAADLFTTMPLDVVVLILSHTNVKDTKNLAMVSRVFRKAVWAPSRIRAIFSESPIDSATAVAFYRQLTIQVQSVTKEQIIAPDADADGPHAQRLEYLQRAMRALEEGLLLRRCSVQQVIGVQWDSKFDLMSESFRSRYHHLVALLTKVRSEIYDIDSVDKYKALQTTAATDVTKLDSYFDDKTEKAFLLDLHAAFLRYARVMPIYSLLFPSLLSTNPGIDRVAVLVQMMDQHVVTLDELVNKFKAGLPHFAQGSSGQPYEPVMVALTRRAVGRDTVFVDGHPVALTPNRELVRSLLEIAMQYDGLYDAVRDIVEPLYQDLVREAALAVRHVRSKFAMRVLLLSGAYDDIVAHWDRIAVVQYVLEDYRFLDGVILVEGRYVSTRETYASALRELLVRRYRLPFEYVLVPVVNTIETSLNADGYSSTLMSVLRTVSRVYGTSASETGKPTDTNWLDAVHLYERLIEPLYQRGAYHVLAHILLKLRSENLESPLFVRHTTLDDIEKDTLRVVIMDRNEPALAAFVNLIRDYTLVDEMLLSVFSDNAATPFTQQDMVFFDMLVRTTQHAITSRKRANQRDRWLYRFPLKVFVAAISPVSIITLMTLWRFVWKRRNMIMTSALTAVKLLDPLDFKVFSDEDWFSIAVVETNVDGGMVNRQEFARAMAAFFLDGVRSAGDTLFLAHILQVLKHLKHGDSVLASFSPSELSKSPFVTTLAIRLVEQSATTYDPIVYGPPLTPAQALDVACTLAGLDLNGEQVPGLIRALQRTEATVKPEWVVVRDTLR